MRIGRRAWIGGVGASLTLGAAALYRGCANAEPPEPSELDRFMATLVELPSVQLEVDAETSPPRVLVTLVNIGEAWLSIADQARLETAGWGDLLIVGNTLKPFSPTSRDLSGLHPPRASFQTLIGPGQRLVDAIPLPASLGVYQLGSNAISAAELKRLLYVFEVAELTDLGLVEMERDGRISPIYGVAPDAPGRAGRRSPRSCRPGSEAQRACP